MEVWMFIANFLLRWLHWGDLLDSLLIWFCPNFSSISSFKSSTLLTAASYRGDWFWGLNWARAPPWGPIGQPPLHSHKIKVFGKFLQKKSFDCNETKAGGSEPYLKVNLHFQEMIGQGRLFKNGWVRFRLKTQTSLIGLSTSLNPQPPSILSTLNPVQFTLSTFSL